LSMYCYLFFQSMKKDGNLFDLDKIHLDSTELVDIDKDKLPKYVQPIRKSIFEYICKIKLPKSVKEIPDNYEELKIFLEELLLDQDQSNEIIAKSLDREPELIEKKDNDLSEVSQDELLKKYYTELLKKTEGNKTSAAKIAGLPYATFRDSLKKVGLS
jgi:DNA-binding NtrC family response regulator